MPHISSSFWQPGRRAGGRRWCHIRRSRRCRSLRATRPAEPPQRLPANTGNEAKRGICVENSAAPSAAATAAAAAARARAAVTSPTWRTDVTATARAVATRKQQIPGKRSVSGCRGSVPSSSMGTSCHRSCAIAVARRLQTIPEAEGDPQWTSAESLSGRNVTSMAPLVGVKTPCLGGKFEKEDESEGEIKEENEEQAEEKEAEGKGDGKDQAEVKLRKDTAGMEKMKVQDKGQEEKEEVVEAEKTGEKVEVKDEKEEDEEKDEMEEKRDEVGVKEEKGWGVGVDKKTEAKGGDDWNMAVTGDGKEWGKAKEDMEEEGKEEEMDEKREKIMVGVNEDEEEEKGEENEMLGKEEQEGKEEEEEKEGREGVKDEGVMEEGEVVGVEEEKEMECGNREDEETGEKDDAEEEEQEEEEEKQEGWATAGGGISAVPMGVEASAIVRSGSEASSVDSTFGSLSEGGHRGSLVPAKFRPLGSEGDVLCAWNLTMVPTKQDAAILGSGAFGSVVEVTTEKGQELAMKVVVKAGSSHSRIKTENKLLQECSAHPHVVDQHGSINTPERLYIIMSKADTTLLSMTKGGVAVDEVQAAQCIRQLMSAVEFLHDRMIIHRDIKPGNILLQNGAVLLADFGLAVRTKGGQFAQSDGCGTEMYMAPELMFGMPYGLAVDMWAIGVVTFELLHSMHPFWPNRQRIDLPSRNASGGGAIAALNGASGIRLPNTLHSSGFFSGFNGISEGSSLHSSVFFSDVGEDAGPLFDVGNEESVGPGALSSGKAASSAGVHAVEVSPSPLPHDMLARQTHSEAKAVFKKKVMKAHFTVKEDLEQTAIDFITKLLCPFSSDRMSAAEAAKHEWLNRSPEDHAWRSELRARTIDAMAAKRASRLDAAVFKAEQAADNVQRLEERVQRSSVLRQQSSVTVSAAAAEANGDVVLTLHECAQRVTSMAVQAREAQTCVGHWEVAIAAGETCAPPDMQEAGMGEVRFVGSYAEHKANESVRQAEKSAGEAEARSTAAAAAVETWERRLADIAEEAVAVETAKVAEEDENGSLATSRGGGGGNGEGSL